ncbi:MAG: class I SAM-dependent methyltransferase [Clostridia bacterium]|nr:class I SAM-dependent methyltransferase [Clostridia bacterium]
MHSLSQRLKTVASMIPQGTSVCDVGTDHGYLPAALYLSGNYGSITATDICEKPLENARKNIRKLGANGVNLILCDGLEKVEKENAQTVVIAGMGGDVISGIIERCPFKKHSLFVLQPMTAAKVLRIFLAENGFSVIKETAVAENGKIYSVMLCRFEGKKQLLSPAKKRIGELKPTTEENIAYIKKQYNICKKCIADLEKAGVDSPLLSETKTALAEIKNILEG